MKNAKIQRGVAVSYGRDGDVKVRLENGDEVWSAGLVPGDEVEVELLPRATPRRARVLAISKPGPERREPLCPLATCCGGCSLAHVERAATERIKLESVTRSIRGVVPVRFVPSPSELGYRRRTRMHYQANKKNRSVGFLAPRSNDLVDVPSCIVLDPRLDAAVAAFRARILPSLVGKGDLRVALGAGGPVIAIRTNELLPTAAYDAVRIAVEEGHFAGAAIHLGGGALPALFGDAVERTPQPDGSDLEGTVDGFSQANDAVALAMAETVRAEANTESARVLELYAGHGHLSIGLAKDAKRFIAVESAKDAAAALERNLAIRGLAGKVLATDAKHAPTDGADVVVLDPPRTGAADAIAAVLANRPKRIIMASCDARTLERDLAKLAEAGFEVASATAFDMFPGTPHVEAVVRLERSRSR